MVSRANDGDAALLRRTRLRLLAWSGGLTLLLLLLLGGALYTAASMSLAASNTDILAARADDLAHLLVTSGFVPDHFVLGPGFGDESSGSLAMIVRPDGSLIGPPGLPGAGDLPDAAAVAAAQTGRVDVRTAQEGDIPVRIYSLAVPLPEGTYVIQVLGERTAEAHLLEVLLFVLALGGLVALAAALAAGYFYAGRALIPVRAAMERRDAALRRQREFAANASHELRLPLTVIGASLVDLARHRRSPVEKVGEALADIEAETGHLTALVEDLLLLARSDSGALSLERAPLDLADVAVVAAGTCTPAATAAGVRLEIDPRPASLLGDAARLRQLIAILLDNALRHSRVGSLVTARVRSEGPQVVLTVEDEGPGIREQDLPHLFERFWRADDAPAGGTGLGLAIAAEIVAAHGGTISAHNRAAGGTSFLVRLPADGTG
jgi:signal transduction histidine kinase